MLKFERVVFGLTFFFLGFWGTAWAVQYGTESFPLGGFADWSDGTVGIVSVLGGLVAAGGGLSTPIPFSRRIRFAALGMFWIAFACLSGDAEHGGRYEYEAPIQREFYRESEIGLQLERSFRSLKPPDSVLFRPFVDGYVYAFSKLDVAASGSVRWKLDFLSRAEDIAESDLDEVRIKLRFSGKGVTPRETTLSLKKTDRCIVVSQKPGYRRVEITLLPPAGYSAAQVDASFFGVYIDVTATGRVTGFRAVAKTVGGIALAAFLPFWPGLIWCLFRRLRENETTRKTEAHTISNAVSDAASGADRTEDKASTKRAVVVAVSAVLAASLLAWATGVLSCAKPVRIDCEPRSGAEPIRDIRIAGATMSDSPNENGWMSLSQNIFGMFWGDRLYREIMIACPDGKERLIRSVRIAIGNKLYRFVSPDSPEQADADGLLEWERSGKTATVFLSKLLPVRSRFGFRSASLNGSGVFGPEVLLRWIGILGFGGFVFVVYRETVGREPGSIKRKVAVMVAVQSFLVSGIVLLVLNLLIHSYYTPEIQPILWQAEAHMLDVSHCVPEPVERLQYVATVLFSPFILAGAFLCCRHRIKTLDFRGLNAEFVFSCAVPVASVFLLVTFFDYHVDDYRNWDSYFEFFNETNLAFYAAAVFPFLLLIAFRPASRFARWGTGLLLLVCLALILFFSFIRIFSRECPPAFFHFGPVAYSIQQATHGKTCLVDLPAQYGAYSLFLEPVFQLVPPNIANVTAVLSVLYFACCVLLLSTARLCTETSPGRTFFSSRNGNLPTLLAVLFILSIGSAFAYIDPYFQYCPIRVIQPLLTLWLLAVYYRRRWKPLLYLLPVQVSLAVFWNLDTGLVALLACLLSLSYDTMLSVGPDRPRRLIVALLKRWGIAGLILGGILGAGVLYLYLRSGRMPDFASISQYQRLFYLSGFFMLPMPVFGLWNLVALIYATGLLYACAAFFNRHDSYSARMILSLSVMGIGLFAYYQGRSHPGCLAACSYPAILLTAVFCDRLISRSRTTRFAGPSLPGYVGAFLLFFLGYCGIFTIPESLSILPRYRLNLDGRTSGIRTENVAFIRNHSTDREPVVILGGWLINDTLSGHDVFYWLEADRRSAPNLPSSAETLTQEQERTRRDFLRDNRDVKVFVERQYLGFLARELRGYEVTAFCEGGTLVLLERKR